MPNNHIYDYPKQILSMLSLVDEEEIPYWCIAKNNGSFSPLKFEEDGIEHATLGHYWEAYTPKNRNMQTDDKIVDCSYHKFYRM